MPDAELPQWLDKLNVSSIAVLKLDDGECLTAEVLKFDDDRDVLVVDVLSSDHSGSDSSQRGRAIPVSRVVSVEVLPRAEQGWPYSDPCRAAPFSLTRFVLMTTLFLCLTIGSVPLFLLLIDRPYGLQAASSIAYTLFAVFFTFGATKGFRPYRFTCPAIRPRIPGLLWRHLGFLAALFVLQTGALAVRPSLPDWWHIDDGKGTPFDFVLWLLCLGLAYAQVFTNRSVIDRAHREFSA